MAGQFVLEFVECFRLWQHFDPSSGGCDEYWVLHALCLAERFDEVCEMHDEPVFREVVLFHKNILDTFVRFHGDDARSCCRL